MWFAMKNEETEIIVLMESSCTGKVLYSTSEWWVIGNYYVFFTSKWKMEKLTEKMAKFFIILDEL